MVLLILEKYHLIFLFEYTLFKCNISAQQQKLAIKTKLQPI